MKREEHEKPEHAGPSGTWKESEIMDFGEDTAVFSNLPKSDR